MAGETPREQNPEKKSETHNGPADLESTKKKGAEIVKTASSPYQIEAEEMKEKLTDEERKELAVYRDSKTVELQKLNLNGLNESDAADAVRKAVGIVPDKIKNLLAKRGNPQHIYTYKTDKYFIDVQLGGDDPSGVKVNCFDPVNTPEVANDVKGAKTWLEFKSKTLTAIKALQAGGKTPTESDVVTEVNKNIDDKLRQVLKDADWQRNHIVTIKLADDKVADVLMDRDGSVVVNKY